MQQQANQPMPWLILALMIALAFIQGCSVMPYKEQSSCQYRDFGKCISISDAYSEAVKKPSTSNNYSITTQPNNYSLTAQSNNSSITTQQNYQNLLHSKMQSIISTDEMPLLRPAVVRRVLINSYKSKDSDVWSEARHIYYIEQQPQWMLESPNTQRPKQQNYLNL